MADRPESRKLVATEKSQHDQQIAENRGAVADVGGHRRGRDEPKRSEPG